MAGPTVATWVSFASRAASFVVLYPFVLRRYDQAEILFWLSVSLPVSMLALIDAGMTPTAVRFFSYGIAASEDSDKEAKWKLESVIGTVRVVYRKLTLGALLVSAGLAIWVMHNQPQLPSYLVGWGITVLSVTAYFYSFPHQAWLQAAQRIPELRFREAKFQLSAMFICAGLAMFHVNILAIVFINAASLLMLASFHIRSARQGAFSYFWSRAPSYDRLVAHELYESSWKSGVGVMASYGLNQGICAWYAGAASPTVAAQFLLTMRLLQVASQVSQAPFYTKIPSLVASYSKNQITTVVDIARRGMSMSMWTYAALAFGISVVAPQLLQLIASKTTLMPATWLYVAIIVVGLERSGAMLVQTYTITNIVHWHWLNSAAAAFAIAAGAQMWPWLKDLAVPLAWGSAMLFIYVPVGCFLGRQLVGAKATILLIRESILPLSFLLLLISAMVAWLS